MDANEAGRSERSPGEPAYDVSDGREAGRIGLRPCFSTGFRANAAVEGTFRWDSLDGLFSRDEMPSTMTQLALISPAPFSRCILLLGRVGVVWSCDMYSGI